MISEMKAVKRDSCHSTKLRRRGTRGWERPDTQRLRHLNRWRELCHGLFGHWHGLDPVSDDVSQRGGRCSVTVTNLLLANEDGTRGVSGERGHCYTRYGIQEKKRRLWTRRGCWNVVKHQEKSDEVQ